LADVLGRQASEHKAAMTQALWEAEMELSRSLEALEVAVHKFNSKAADLQVS
jgi:hypothetical protein